MKVENEKKTSLILQIGNNLASSFRKRNSGEDVEKIASGIQKIAVEADKYWNYRKEKADSENHKNQRNDS